MINFNKLVGVVLLLACTGCGRAVHYNMGKGDDIAKEAESHWHDTDWATDVQKEASDKSCIFPVGKPKCNLFVYDVLCGAGVTPPKTRIWPITAKMWTEHVMGWSTVSSQQKGDVVSSGTHCGIAVSSTMTMTADTKRVQRNSLSGTIKRYDG